ncbi:MAG: electron transport complex subunit RsxC [Bacteroidales bacterium]|jgi:electron transport complex protein RnfC|nr:electron transport complex subunit RsxC [Bacteroidales bacterium]
MQTFKLGGVHPPENKLSAEEVVETLALPKQVIVPLGQHLGAPATAVVNRGDEVKVGQLIAKSSGFISANIHSPVSGKVFKIDDVYDASGFRKPSIIINVAGDEWLESIDRSEDICADIKLNQKEIVDKLNEMGIVGLGGAAFPSYVKLMVPDGKKVDYLLINGVECEPYLTSDHRLMMEKGEEMLIGATILMKGLNTNKAMIGIENNKPDAIEHLTRLATKYKGISVHSLKVKYPQGGEKQLIKALTGREVPSGKLPLEVGCVVNNVGTAFAVYEAVQKNKPLFERVVTITGKSIKKPSNFLVRIGTPIKELIEAANGIPENTGKIISGGPMMGKAVLNDDIPVVKGTSGILLMPDTEAKRREINTCIRCSKCVSVCPMGLEPFLLSKASMLAKFDIVEKELVMDCIECGSCSYTCPSNIPLLDYIRLGKNKVGQIIRNRNQK